MKTTNDNAGSLTRMVRLKKSLAARKIKQWKTNRNRCLRLNLQGGAIDAAKEIRWWSGYAAALDDIQPNDPR